MGVVEDQVPIVATIEVSEENESQEEGERSSSSTLFEIFIFCPKIQLRFPEKIVDFWGGEKFVKMLWFWTF